MPLELEYAVQMIRQALQEVCPSFDLWRPAADGPGKFFDSPGRPSLHAPCLLGDDGNMLLAVVNAPGDGDQVAGSWERFANDGIRLLATLLRRAADDYGMHRLLLILILPENETVASGLRTALASSRVTSGEFRLFMLPSLDQSDSVFQMGIAEHLKIFSPFPSAPFLEPTGNIELASYVDEVFIKSSKISSPLQKAIEKDVRAFLVTGAWESAQGWPSVESFLNNQSCAMVGEADKQ